MAVLIVLVQAGPASAQVGGVPTDPPSAPPVEEVVQRALERAPSLAAQRERTRAAELAVPAAGALPDPMVELEYQSFNFPRYTIGSDPGSMAGASLSQGLLSRDRRATRRALAGAEAGRRTAERRLTSADLATEVRVQYARLYAIDREREALVDALQIARMLEATSSARYAAGSSDQATVIRLQLEQTRVGQRSADLEAERLVVQAAINRLTNDPPDAPVGRVEALPPPGLPAALTALAELAVERSPAVALRQAEVDLASRQVDAARAELRPSWSFGAGLYWQGGLDRMARVSVGLELPLWKTRKQVPLVASAESERRAAELELSSMAIEVRTRVAALLAGYQNALSQIDRYQGGLIPQNRAALDATRASYLSGRGDFSSVLDEFRRWVDLRIELAGREAERFAIQAQLVALLGEDAAASAQ